MCFVVTARKMGKMYAQTETEESDVGLNRVDSLTSVGGFSSRSYSITDDTLQGKGRYGFYL